MLTFVGGFVVIGHRFGLSLVSEHRARITSIGLRMMTPQPSQIAGRPERTTMILPSFVTKATTAVHPEGSLKKLGSG